MRTVIAVMLATAGVLITGGSESIAASENSYSLTEALKITEKVVDRFGTFQTIESNRRHLPCNGCRDWYGRLTITGSEWKEALIAHTEILAGGRFRVRLPNGQSVNTRYGTKKTGGPLTGWLVRDVRWTQRTEKIPGFDAYITHTFAKKRNSVTRPIGCNANYRNTDPSDLFNMGFNAFLSGQKNGGCGYGAVDARFGYSPPRPSRGGTRGGMEGGGGIGHR